MSWIMQTIEWLVSFLRELGLTGDDILGGLRAAGAFVAGLVMSWIVTQRIKRWRKWGGWKPRALAIGLGFAVCFSIWPGWTVAGFWFSVMAGLGAPILFDLFVAWARHRWGWWPKEGKT